MSRRCLLLLLLFCLAVRGAHHTLLRLEKDGGLPLLEINTKLGPLAPLQQPQRRCTTSTNAKSLKLHEQQT